MLVLLLQACLLSLQCLGEEAKDELKNGEINDRQTGREVEHELKKKTQPGEAKVEQVEDTIIIEPSEFAKNSATYENDKDQIEENGMMVKKGEKQQHK